MPLTSVPVGGYTAIGSAFVPGIGTAFGALADVVNNIFGGDSRVLLTYADWRKLFPDVGKWNNIVYTAFTTGKEAGWIKYNVDVAYNLPIYLNNVAYDYAGDLNPLLQNGKDGQSPAEFQKALATLKANLASEVQLANQSVVNTGSSAPNGGVTQAVSKGTIQSVNQGVSSKSITAAALSSNVIIYVVVGLVVVYILVLKK